MTTPHLPEVEGMVDVLAGEIEGATPDARATWQVNGRVREGAFLEVGLYGVGVGEPVTIVRACGG